MLKPAGDHEQGVIYTACVPVRVVDAPTGASPRLAPLPKKLVTAKSALARPRAL